MSQMRLNFSGLKFEEVNSHVNKMPFSGICMFVDKPSDAVPYGSDKPVVFSKEDVEKALNTFVGMGVDCRYDDWISPEYALTGHDDRFKIGVVESAEITEDGVLIKGFLWCRDFYDVCYMIKNAKDSLGFSIEVAVTSAREDDEFFYVKDFSYTGVAILYKDLAAFKGTSLAASKKKEKNERDGDGLTMTPEQLQEILDAVAKVGIDFAAFNEKVDALAVKVEALEQKETNIDFSAVTAELKEIKEKLPVGEVKPKTYNFAAKTGDKTLSFQEKLDEIDKDTTLSKDEKMAKKMEAFHNRNAE